MLSLVAAFCFLTPVTLFGFPIVFQVVCGQNCTFLVQSNGTVLAVGEGQYGRLGQGNSDDLYVPTIISAFQGTLFTPGLLLDAVTEMNSWLRPSFIHSRKDNIFFLIQTLTL